MGFRRALSKNKYLYRFYEENRKKRWMKTLEHGLYNVAFAFFDMFKPYYRRYVNDCIGAIDRATNISYIAAQYMIYNNNPQEYISDAAGYIIFNKKNGELSGDLKYFFESIKSESQVIKIRTISADKPRNKRVLTENKNIEKLLADLMRCQYRFYSDFGEHNLYYEGYERLDLKGLRNTENRLKLYDMKSHLHKEDAVLDIGCNCGFLDITIAPLVKSIDGIEYNEGLLKYARRLSRIVGVQNTTFIQGDFKEFNTEKKYDLILSFAVHKWIGLPEREYFIKLKSFLSDKGEILFETHELETMDKGIEENINAYISGIFEISHKQKFYDVGCKQNRIFYYLKSVSS